MGLGFGKARHHVEIVAERKVSLSLSLGLACAGLACADDDVSIHEIFSIQRYATGIHSYVYGKIP